MATFKNNRNNGFVAAKTASEAFEVGDFLVYTGLGGVIPYNATTSIKISGVVGTFVVGETVTGGTSGATGVVYRVFPTGLLLTGITGTFQAAETLTGGTSGATATSGAIVTNNKIVGLSNEQITSASPNYAATSDIGISTPVNLLDVLAIPVSNGTATAALVGTYVDVDPANPGSVDVSAAGSQILVTRVVDADNIIGAIALVAA